ncbi:MAG: YggS family pyridoxal phosphate-dependent enzyme [candidate division Zixibacteria bacterium]|nr:YggS family pyridoxal phosphate-dependent enzyme [candidate division Zixibacteria bacterium]
MIVDEKRAGQIAENVRAVRSRIDQAARESGRGGDEITLVAVSKTHPAEMIEAAVACGVTDIGENRVQEAAGKIERLGHIARWHLIGHLQSNKAATAVRLFDMIQALDSVALAYKVSQAATAQGKTVDCLIEVNSSGEATKFGLAPQEVIATAGNIVRLPGIVLRGLMTIGPLTDDMNQIRRAFEMTAGLFDRMKTECGPRIDTLSMGMSGDFETAIRCGATMVRVGAAIFGGR